MHTAWNSVPNTFSVDALEAILKLSQMYTVEDGIKFACQRLYSKKYSIPPVRLLGISLKYGLSLLFMHAFRTLADIPLDDLSAAELELVPSSILCKLRIVRHNVRTHRQDLVLNKLSIYGKNSRCAQGLYCFQQMQTRWDYIAHPMLLSPEWHSAETIARALVRCLRQDRTCRNCAQLYREVYESELVRDERRIILKASRAACKSEGLGCSKASGVKDSNSVAEDLVSQLYHVSC